MSDQTGTAILRTLTLAYTTPSIDAEMAFHDACVALMDQFGIVYEGGYAQPLEDDGSTGEGEQ